MKMFPAAQSCQNFPTKHESWSVREVNEDEEQPGNAECAPGMTQELSSAY